MFALAGLLAALTLGRAAHAEEPEAERIGVVTALQGAATIQRASSGIVTALRFRDEIFARDRISTDENGRVQILMGGKALVTVRERSQMVIMKTLGLATIDLQAGKIVLSVVKSLMKPGELFQIVTPRAVAGIRGTVAIAEATAKATRMSVLKGAIDVAPHRESGQDPVTEPVWVHTAEAIDTTSVGTLPAAASKLVPEAIQSLVDENRGVLRPAPLTVYPMVKEIQIQTALDHARALAEEGVEIPLLAGRAVTSGLQDPSLLPAAPRLRKSLGPTK